MTSTLRKQKEASKTPDG